MNNSTYPNFITKQELITITEREVALLNRKFERMVETNSTALRPHSYMDIINTRCLLAEGSQFLKFLRESECDDLEILKEEWLRDRQEKVRIELNGTSVFELKGGAPMPNDMWQNP